MGFNNARERRKFEKAWKTLRKQYRDAGFSEEGINAMRAFDEDAYRGERRFYEHTCPLPEDIAVPFDESCLTGRHAWADAIDDPALAFGLKQLTRDDLELLTLFAFESYSQPEIARLLGCTQQNISKRIGGYKNNLKK